MVGSLPRQRFSALPVSCLLLHHGQGVQGLGAAVVGGAVAEVVGPLEAVAVLGGFGELVQVVGVGEVGVGGVPERSGWAQVAASGAAVLFEIVGEPEHRSRRRSCVVGAGGGGGRVLRGAGCGAAQRGLLAVDRLGEFGVGGFGPVVGELVVVVLAEVAGGGVGEKGVPEVEADAESTRVHRCFQQGSCGRGGLFVAAQQFRGAGQVLGHSAVIPGAGEGVGQQPVTVLGESGGRGQGARVEGVGDGQRVAGQQFPGPAVGIVSAWSGQGRVLVGVLGPQRAQHQHRPALLITQQSVHGRRDQLADSWVAKVVLSLVQPHHRPRSDLLQLLQRGLRAGRVEGMPQPPPLHCKRLHRLPARPRLPRRRRPHQEHDLAATS